MNIYGKKVVLRAIEPEDMPLLYEMINDPDIEAKVGGWSFPISRAEQQNWYEVTLKDKENHRFIIETRDKAENQSIGMIYISYIDWKNRNADIGIKLTSSAPKRKGYATDAVVALLSFAFQELQLNRANLKILSDNIASIGLFEKCGAQREGVSRCTVYKNGKYIDQYYYGILRLDFFNSIANIGW